ncbi:3-carboxy-cis,cis-muconate cycloisomerase [Cryptococcus bacillisporus CA1280]|uniref:3-carboxy-cis,cis-muconate cycloisomerase n=1 Tax=Cryptococcus bacillisporus CA1280 TaxID=1296109 RepID=A0A0D0V961_CRYGA|nr:3-carboxy-cis,cis-muconate cycloisomerase [Cryptococcus bacillisporus CA1280]
MNNSISAYDSSLFRNIFTTDRMRAEFTDSAYVTRCVQAEVALAEAQAQHDVIPREAANRIKAGCNVDKLDMERLRMETDIVGYPILPLIKQLEGMCEGDSGRYLHWGATTQDIMDLAAILQMQAGLAIIEDQIQNLRRILTDLATKYRDTPMAGRTHLQHALPITFGYKAAVFLSSFDRHYERLKQLEPRCLMVQFGGAAGTLASLGDSDVGLKVRAQLAENLDLANPPISWHVARDGVAEVLSFLALVGGSLGKIALDLIIMCSNEFSEVQEPFVPHRGASSTMPQKRNPISSEVMLAASKLLRNHSTLGQDGMISDFERASGPWHLEWVAIPEAFCVASGALYQAEFALGGLCVDTDRMMVNLNSSKGLIVGEAVMMGIAPTTGRNEAHDIVYTACKDCIENGHSTLYDELLKNSSVVAMIGKDKLAELCDPRNYLGSCQRMVDDVIEDGRRKTAFVKAHANGNGKIPNGY